MNAPFDETDFVDRDLQASGNPRAGALPAAAGSGGVTPRPPTREELDHRVSETQHRIAELKRAQEELERERVALEEARRRRVELETGRTEMLQHLTRGVGLLEKAEFEARRDAEQMNRTLAAFREALERLQAIKEETWTQETWNTELTKALTTIENARMEWNAARLKWAALNRSPQAEEGASAEGDRQTQAPSSWRQLSFGEWTRLGLAFTWPLALVLLLALLAFITLRWR